MKKLLYLLMCISLIFSSCKKEDDSPNSGSTNNTSASILGTWEIASVTSTNTEGYLHPIQGTEIITSTDNDSQNYPNDGMTFFWFFYSDGTYSQASYENGDLQAINELNYLKQGNNLSIGMDGYGNVGQTYTITTLTNSTLSFNWSNSDNDIINDTTYFYNNTGSATFNKSNKKIDSNIQSQNKTGKTPFFKQFIDRRNQ